VPLFFAQTLVQSMRDVGYNHTTSALCEHLSAGHRRRRRGATRNLPLACEWQGAWRAGLTEKKPRRVASCRVGEGKGFLLLLTKRKCVEGTTRTAARTSFGASSGGASVPAREAPSFKRKKARVAARGSSSTITQGTIA
jgi:hypothetical protein